MRYGSLGIHTVEMDATPTSGKGGFEELSTFLVTDLGVTMAAPATTAPGDTVQLRVTASNGNSVVARGVTVTDVLPPGLRLKQATAPVQGRRRSHHVRAPPDAGTLEPGLRLHDDRHRRAPRPADRHRLDQGVARTRCTATTRAHASISVA